MLGMPTRDLKSFHPNEITRAARIGWNTLLAIHKDFESTESPEIQKIWHAVDLAMKEMNRKGVFDKPGTVLSGPIPGDTAGNYVTVADVQKHLNKLSANALNSNEE